MDHEFRTDAPNGLSQLDSLFAQIRQQACEGRVCHVLVTKTGKTTIVIEPMPRGTSMPMSLAEPPTVIDETEPDDPTDLMEEEEEE